MFDIRVCLSINAFARTACDWVFVGVYTQMSVFINKLNVCFGSPPVGPSKP